MLSADKLCKQIGTRSSRHNVGPGLDPNCLTLIIFLKEYFEKNQQTAKNVKNYQVGKELTNIVITCWILIRAGTDKMSFSAK